jgi:hypothetical protein
MNRNMNVGLADISQPDARCDHYCIVIHPVEVTECHLSDTLSHIKSIVYPSPGCGLNYTMNPVDRTFVRYCFSASFQSLPLSMLPEGGEIRA